MAKNVVTMPKSKEEKEVSKATKLSDFLVKNRVLLLSVLAVIVVAIIAFVLVITIRSKVIKAGLDKIEVIEYAYKKDASDISSDEVLKRQTTALQNLEGLLGKGGIVGSRANMLCADIYQAQKKFGDAINCWKAAAKKSKGNYIESLCYFNAAVCLEETGDKKSALELYETVAQDKNFVDRSRAYFNAGRIKESLGDYEDARKSYETIATLGYSSDTWADLARTRIIQMRIDGNIE